jgi:SAM-dependent methyltransferases related to tRNA (uracil-5-)-methyltransferase
MATNNPQHHAGAAGTGGSDAGNGVVGKALELEITTVAHGGIFVARHEGRVVFVADTLPGERVLARVSDAGHAGFWRAETVEVLEASPHRRAHVWAEASVDRDPAERAGGAEFGHIELGRQRELKREVLTDALSRMAGLDRGVLDRDVRVEAVPGDDEANGLGWRTRVSLHVAPDGTIGPFAARSHRVIPVASLPLATPAVQDAAPLEQTFPGAASVDIVAAGDGSTHVLVDSGRSGADRSRQGHRRAGRGEADRRQGGRPGGRRGTGTESTASQEAGQAIRELVAGRKFRLDAAGFWQVHRRAAETLYRAVQDVVPSESFDPRAANLDLYGGVGLLAAALGDRFGSGTRVTSVESSTRTTDFAAENLSDWVGASAVTDRVDRYLQRVIATAGASERSRLRAATIVLDPPRSGAGKGVVAQLLELRPAQLVYVACDPVALARDVAFFAAGGYELRTIRAFDLFPHTHHLEAVALLSPNG